MPPEVVDQKNSLSIAVMQTELAYLKASMTELKFQNAQQSAKLDTIIAAMAEARGGWRTLLLLGGAAGSVGACVPWVLSHLKV